MRHSRTRQVAAAFAALLIAGSAAACGGDDTESGNDAGGTESAQPADGGAGKAVSEVAMSDDFKFGPDTVAAKKGATITAKNVGSIQHDLKLRQGGKEVGGTPIVDGGKSATFKVDVAPGDYEMFCSVAGHEDAGMKGTFTVE